MKRKITVLLVIATLIVSCFMITGCGGSDGTDIWVVVSETDNGREYTYKDIEVDENGHIVKKVEKANTYTYEYDKEGLLVKEVKANTLYGTDTTVYEYDENGLVVRCVETSDDPDDDVRAFVYSYTFDGEGRVASMKIENENADWSAVTKYTYNEDGKIDTATEHSSKVYTTKYYYDDNGNVSNTYTTATGWTRERTFVYENMGTYSVDAENPPLGEKFRHFRENYNK